MGCDTELSARMHIRGANLNLHRLAIRADYGCMERLIQVELGHRNVILETTRNRAPTRVYCAQYCVTIPDVIDDYTNANQIVDLTELASAHDHLLEDAVEMLLATLDGGPDAFYG